MKTVRTYLAGILAFLIGVPLTQEALAQDGDIFWASLNLADAIASTAADSDS